MLVMDGVVDQVHMFGMYSRNGSCYGFKYSCFIEI